MKNTLLFTYSTNILVRLLKVNMKNFLTPKMRNSIEKASPSSGTSSKVSGTQGRLLEALEVNV